MIKRKMEIMIEELKNNEVYEDIIKELKTITLLKNTVSDETIDEVNKLINFLNGDKYSYCYLYNLEKYVYEQYKIYNFTIGKNMLMMVSDISINNSIQKSVILYIIYAICTNINNDIFSEISFYASVRLYINAYKAAKQNKYKYYIEK